MSEKTLSSLIQILALLSKIRSNTAYAVEKNMVISFLQKQYPLHVVEKYTHEFESVFSGYEFTLGDSEEDHRLALQMIDGITLKVFNTVSFKQRIYILVSLFEFSKYLKLYLDTELALASYFEQTKHISQNFKLSNELYHNCKNYALNDYHLMTQKANLILISGEKLSFVSRIKNLVVPRLEGLIYALKVDPEFFLLKYEGGAVLYLDNQIVKSDLIYFFTISSSLYNKDYQLLFFNDINRAYIDAAPWDKLIYTAKDIEFRYRNSENGIRPFSFTCESNEMIGIIGGSGAGKTTLLNLLTGSIPLKAGSIDVNGYELSSSFLSKGFIGYVPQDDLLIEELTVYQNLYYSAKLCKRWKTETILREKVLAVLEVLQLDEIKDLKVGSVLQKTISGGQRKRLNIALEIIREPILFFIDEPTSGLSSTDSYHIIHMLKQQALNQKLLFVNIHQPSNDIFYLFDKIIFLDKGGYPIYFGPPGGALEYFRNSIRKLETIQSGKYQTEQEEILSIIEETYVDEFGNVTTERLIKPVEWYQRFILSGKNEEISKRANIKLPKRESHVPQVISQYATYFKRNVLSKVADTQYKVMSLSITPTLAIILSFLCKQYVWDETRGNYYVFSQNDNIPGFYFMSVIVAMFVGLIVSAEEIFRDKKLFVRERFLNLNKCGYYASKLSFLFILSFIQTGVYVLLSSLILKLSCNITIFWLIMFLTAFLANTIGLMVSKWLKSLVAIYIAIPLLLVPQILLSGVVVNYDKLHPWVSSEKYVPLIGDVMPTRWAYEALIVNQFKYNEYQQQIFTYEQEESMLSYSAFVLLPEIKRMANAATRSAKIPHYLKLIKHELSAFPEYNKRLNGVSFVSREVSEKDIDAINTYIAWLQKQLLSTIQNVQLSKDKALKTYLEQNPGAGLRENNYNKSVADLALNRTGGASFKVLDNNIQRLYEPIYFVPKHRGGRSHFFAAEKNLANMHVNSIVFNFFVLTLMVVLAIILLIVEPSLDLKGWVNYSKK